MVFDPNREQTISAATHHMRVDYSAYEGMAREGRDRDRAVAGTGDRGKQRIQGQSRRAILKTRDLHREVIGMNQTIRFGRRFCLIALSAWLLPLTGCVLAGALPSLHNSDAPGGEQDIDSRIPRRTRAVEQSASQRRKLALKLRAQYPDTIRVETVENKKRNLALELIRRAFDRNHDGQLDAQERANVRLIIYGQSFGGAAVVKLARELERMGAPVLLTVQVDKDAATDPRQCGARRQPVSEKRTLHPW